MNFCSATYRLFKPDDSDDCSQKDPLMEIKYKGMVFPIFYFLLLLYICTYIHTRMVYAKIRPCAIGNDHDYQIAECYE